MKTTKSKLTVYKLLMFMCIFLMLCMANNALAENCTHYVSPSGTATWATASNISTPTSVQIAFNNAAAGNVVCFRGGTYNVPAKDFGDTYRGYYEPANSGTASQPITFQAYTGETPLFNGVAGGTGDVSDFATILGTNDKNYIVFDGFSLQADSGAKMARMIIHGNLSRSTYITVKNFIINGGTTVLTSTDNREGIRIEAADYITISKNKIYNFRQTTDWHNTSAIKMYHDTNITIENNEIYNCSAGIYYKSDVATAVTRYNYVHDCYLGIFTDAWSTGYNMDNHSYYHNVVANCSYIGIQLYAEDGGTLNNVSVYNNTIYNSSSAGDLYGIFIGANTSYAASNSMTVHSNIIQGTAYKLTFAMGAIAECQNNQYGSLGSFNVRTNYGGGAVTFTSLANWHSSTNVSGGVHPEGASTLNGLASNPLFVNASGYMNKLSDFALQSSSPCVGTGKNGVNMGANISNVGTGASTKTPSAPVLK
jgi:hypothetical protein